MIPEPKTQTPEPIIVELLPWLPRLIGQDEGRKAVLQIEAVEGETVGQFLARVSSAYPNLGAELWDAAKGELRMPIEVAINGSVLGIHHHLSSELQPGDELILLPQYQGG